MQIAHLISSFWSIALKKLGPNIASILSGQLGLLLAQALFLAVGVRTYGASYFGSWVIVSTLPVYLAMTDVGLVTGTVNSIQVSVTRGHVSSAISSFSQAAGALAGISCALTILVTSAAMIYFSGRPEAQNTISHRDVIILVAIFALEFGINTYGSLVTGVLRAYDRFAAAQLLFNSFKIIQYLALAAFALLKMPLVIAYPVTVALKVPLALFLTLWAARQSKWPSKAFFPRNPLGGGGALFGRAVGPFLMTLANAAHYQGLIAAVGAAAGPIASLTFFTARTLVRVPITLTNVLGGATTPIVIEMLGKSDHAGFHRWFAASKLAVFSAALAFAAFLAVFGNLVLTHWTGHSINLTAAGRVFIGIDTVAICVSTIIVFYLIAANRAVYFAAISLLIYLFAVACVLYLRPSDINACLFVVAMANVVVCAVALVSSSKLGGEID